VLLGVLLALLLVLGAIPVGMDHMGDCPACTSPSFILSLCAGILMIFILSLVLSSSWVFLARHRQHGVLLSRSIYRPPRLV
jgi:hypothetical protein